MKKAPPHAATGPGRPKKKRPIRARRAIARMGIYAEAGRFFVAGRTGTHVGLYG